MQQSLLHQIVPHFSTFQSDWKVESDIRRKLVFPPDISTTNLPDMLIWSEKKKKGNIVELTVPWETAVDEAHERKLLKYEELVEKDG